MEGLIKGLIDVALGGGGGEGDGGRQRRGAEEDGRDERSRASWAEVVGSDEHGGGSHGPHPHPQHQQQQQQSYFKQRPANWGRAEVESSEDGGGEGEWETVGERHKRRDQKTKPPQKVPKDSWGGFKRPPASQHYAHDADFGADTDPSEDELSDISKACGKLWDLDKNRLVPGRDYEIDCGAGKRVHQKEDAAAGSLFRWLSGDVLSRPTFSRFCSLLDNYNPDQGAREVVTPEEEHEQEAFVEEISRTAPVKYLHKYLAAKGVVSERCEEFKRVLGGLWFGLYGRGGTGGSSSAFEHVFVGEIKGNGEREISGFHNWIQFYLEEAKGRLDYQGYIFPRRRGEVPDSETQLLTVQFEWNGILKSLSSTLIGVSPEFEVALYTLCFYAGSQDNHVYLGPYPVNIKCYRLGSNRIGSAFPIAES